MLLQFLNTFIAGPILIVKVILGRDALAHL
jgi:hypothetical protein